MKVCFRRHGLDTAVGWRLAVRLGPLYSRGVLRSMLGRSPTAALFLGLIITLAAVVAYSGYITRQIFGLRELQNNLVDRNRKDSLQLLRIQNDLNSLGAGHARHAGQR